MPNGHSYKVANGETTDLKDYLKTAARGMGDLYFMREEPMDAEIPRKYPVRDQLSLTIAELEKEISEVEALNGEELEKVALADIAKKTKSLQDQLNKIETEKARYQSMIAKVKAMEGGPEGLKEFALRMLTEAYEFDCSESLIQTYYQDIVKLSGSVDPEAWKAEKLSHLHRLLSYTHHDLSNEKQRAGLYQKWLDDYWAFMDKE